jgi:hypothetical protein
VITPPPPRRVVLARGTRRVSNRDSRSCGVLNVYAPHFTSAYTGGQFAGCTPERSAVHAK